MTRKIRIQPPLPALVHRVSALAFSVLTLAGGLERAGAQWTGTAGNGIYNDVNNWTGGTINGAFTTVAPPSSLLFDADITTSINFQIDTLAGGTTLSGSGGTRKITLNGDLKASGTGVDTTITIANSLILDLNGATRNFGNTSANGTWTIDAQITGAGGLNLGGGSGYVHLKNVNNDFTGNIKFSRRGGSFASIADAGVASALGAGSTITVDDLTSFGNLDYTGGIASSNRTWNWNLTGGSYVFNQNGTGALTLTGAWNMAAGSVITMTVNANTADLVLEGVMSGNDHIKFGGAAVKTLKGANTISGNFTAANGVLEFTTVADAGVTSALGQGSTVHLGENGNAATLRYIGTVVEGHSTNRTINLAGTTGAVAIEANGAGALIFTADMTATGAGNKTLTLGGTSAAGVQNEVQGAIVNGSVSGTTSLTKAGSNAWTISGTNTYTGLTTVSGGSLTVKGNQSGATGGYLLNAATTSTLNFASGATINVIAGKSINVATGASVGLVLNSAATVTNAGSLSLGRGALLNMTGGTWDQSGSLAVGGNGGFSARLNVTAGVFTYTGSTASIGYNGNLSSIVSVSGTGELRFQGTGDVLVGRGAVNAGNDAVAGDVAVGAGGTLVTQQKFVQNVEEGRISLAGGTVKLSANLGDFSDNLALVLSTATATKFDTNSFTTTVDDVISGTGSGGLEKTGTGNLKLSGANTYTGPTRVSGGLLTANHANALGTGAVTITSGVSLKVGDGPAGQQLVFGSTLVNDGAILMDLFNTAGSSGLDASSADYLTFNGAFSGDLGDITLTNLAGSEDFAIGSRYYLVDWSAVTAALGERSVSLSYDSSFTGLGSAYKFDATNFLSDGYITVTAAPEPGRMALLALGGSLFWLRRRRGFRRH